MGFWGFERGCEEERRRDALYARWKPEGDVGTTDGSCGTRLQPRGNGHRELHGALRRACFRDSDTMMGLQGLQIIVEWRTTIRSQTVNFCAGYGLQIRWAYCVEDADFKRLTVDLEILYWTVTTSDAAARRVDHLRTTSVVCWSYSAHRASESVKIRSVCNRLA